MARERCEDGADDHPLNNGHHKLASLWGEQDGHSLAAAQPRLFHVKVTTVGDSLSPWSRDCVSTTDW